MDWSKVKFSPAGTKKNPYYEYWTESGVRKGNRKKGYFVRTYGKILTCSKPMCNEKLFITNSRLGELTNKGVNPTCSTKCSGFLRSGDRNSNWSGGRYIDRNGYLHVTPPAGHPARDKRGYVLEHRLAMEKHVGRFLEPWEVVHHKN